MPGIWPFSFVFAAPLLVAIEKQATKEQFLLGWWAGIIGIGGSHYFIAETLTLLAKLPWIAAIPAFIAYTAWIGLQIAFFSVGMGWLRRTKSALWLVSGPLWFTFVERTHPVVFRSLTSNTLWEVPILVQSLEWWGSSGLTACLIFVSCCLAHAFTQYRERVSEHPWRPLIYAATLWCGLFVFGHFRMQAIDDVTAEEHLRVSLVQPNVTVEEKRYEHGQVRIDVYKRTMALTRDAMKNNPDLIVWPEGALPITYDPQVLKHSGAQSKTPSIRTRLTRSVHKFAKAIRTPLVFGSLRLHEGRKRNAALYIDPKRTDTKYYDKHKLVLLAERLPLADLFPALTSYVPGAAHHEPGDEFTTFWVKDTPWIPSMCSDALFPRFTSESLSRVQDDRAVLLNLTNDVWFGNTSEPTVHLMMQSPRAVENRSWLVRSTNSGITAIFDPNGVIRARTEPFETATLTYDLPIVSHAPTPYQRYGEWPLLMLGTLLLLLTIRQQQQRGHT
jgi:apolipoprotein N-acyltransferase